MATEMATEMATGVATGVATETATPEGIARAVRFEPCATFSAERDAACPVCDACGWLEDDHALPITGGAIVTELPRRHPPRIERKAS